MAFLTIASRAPDAPLAALAGLGAGLVDNGTHSYKVTFVTAAGETEAGTVSNIVTVADKTVNGQVALTNIPTGDVTVTSRNLYRTVTGNGAPWKLLANIANNTATTYTDNTADSGLTTNAPSANTTGMDVNVAWDEAEKDDLEIGDAARAIDGSYRSTVTLRKREWKLSTPPMVRADANVLESRLSGAGPLSCSGDLLGGTVSCFPELTGWSAIGVPASHKVRLDFSLHEA